jgi:hypothetical protein
MWNDKNLMEQLGNVGSEFSRALNWRSKGVEAQVDKCLLRALELLDSTIADPKNLNRLKELLRFRSGVCDFFYGKNEYGFTSENINQYFYWFGVAARNNREEIIFDANIDNGGKGIPIENFINIIKTI